MAHQCVCPEPDQIGSIPNVDCATKSGIFNKLAFQRLGTPFVDINLESEWTDKIGATNGTKIQISPLFASFEVPNSEANTFGGGDNTTPNSEELVTGETAVLVTGTFLNTPQSIIDDMKLALECERNLGVYFIDQFNNILYAGPSMTGSPIAIQTDTFFISTLKLGGATEPNSHTFRFSLAPHWSTETVLEASAVDLQGLLNT